MVGRAGRRGRDSVGFALLWEGEGADYRQWRQTLSRAPDSLNSAFHLRYDVLLGLLRRLSGDQVAAMVDRSFASFQRADAIAATRNEANALGDEVQSLDPNRRLEGQPCADREVERDAYVTWKERIGGPRDKGKKGQGYLPGVNDLVEPLCPRCPAAKECAAGFRKLNAARNRLIASESKNITLDPAREARRRIQVLGDWGALSPDGRLTAKGELAARIRFPNGLLLLDALPWLQRCSPVELAGGLASFVVQRTTRVREGVKLPDLKRGVDRFQTIEKRAGLSGDTEIGRLAADFEPYAPTRTDDRRVSRSRSFESTAPSEAERRAWLVSRFATGVRWSTLVRTGIADGDLERLVLQTVDLLRDVRYLPGLEDVSRQAIELLARPPIFGSEARPLGG
jgi:superfamily II RNA helicase